MDHLKPYYYKPDGDPLPYFYFAGKQPLPHDESFTVESILQHRVRRDGQHQWLVKWKNFPDSENTWEPASSFLNDVQSDWRLYNVENGITVPFEQFQ